MAVRILVVDADPIVQRALGNALTQAGYQAIALSDGAEALRKLQESTFDALVTDLMMPDGGGAACVCSVHCRPSHQRSRPEPAASA